MRVIVSIIAVFAILALIAIQLDGNENDKGEQNTLEWAATYQATAGISPTATTAPHIPDWETEECKITARACEHFFNIIDDIDAGILTPDEARMKMKEVYQDTAGGTAESREAAQRLVAALTAADAAAFVDAIVDMKAACFDCYL